MTTIRKALLWFLAYVIWFFVLIEGVLGQEHIEARFLDVGQADAVLVSYQGKHLLYDAGLPLGSTDSTKVANRLRELGVDTLAFLAISHPHWDHMAGAPAVLDSLAVLAYASSHARSDTKIYGRLYEALLDETSLTAIPDYGSLGDASLDWLHPPADSTHWSLNDRSMGLRICLDESCLMLTGDAEHAAWEYWLDTSPDKMTPVSVHQSSHHGSRNGDTREALSQLDPEVVVIGTGSSNRYGHPHPEALALYRGVQARVLRTDHHGEVIVEVHRDGSIRTWVERWPDPPRWPHDRWPW